MPSPCFLLRKSFQGSIHSMFVPTDFWSPWHIFLCEHLNQAKPAVSFPPSVLESNNKNCVQKILGTATISPCSPIGESQCLSLISKWRKPVCRGRGRRSRDRLHERPVGQGSQTHTHARTYTHEVKCNSAAWYYIIFSCTFQINFFCLRLLKWGFFFFFHLIGSLAKTVMAFKSPIFRTEMVVEKKDDLFKL